jgi:HopA1 effector protein family
MQLLDSLQNQLPVSVPNNLLDVIEDIASNVQFQSNFCVSHPAYKPLDLPLEVVARFQNVPLDLQKKYLSLQLRSFLYGIYYNGSMRTALALGQSSSDLVLQQNLENNTLLGVDWKFFERLHESNSGQGYFDFGWQVLKQETDGSLVVTKGGLKLHIDRKRHLQVEEQSANVGDLVAIRLPRNLIQNGFYVAVGNTSSDSRKGKDNHPQLVRIYLNLASEGAPAVMESLTQRLNEASIFFSFKVLYNPGDYGRFDSGVLYFERSDYEAVHQILEIVYALQRSHFHTEIPLFTKFLAPGLGLAEEPNQKFSEQESFGMNRCQIITNGLLAAQEAGDESVNARVTMILEQFSNLGVTLEHPYLNTNSEDIYTPINLCK